MRTQGPGEREQKVFAPEINAVLKLVTKLKDNGDDQLTVLVYALAVGLKTLGVDDRTGHELLQIALNTPMNLVVLDDAKAAHIKGLH